MIYFDNAATTMRKPDCVAEAVAQALCSAGNSGRGAHEGALDAARIVYGARCALAELFCAESPDCIAFAHNSTAALNIAIKGVLERGDHAVTTAMEHNSVLRPLYEMEEKGVELTILPADALGRIDYDDFERSIRRNTKAIVCTHASNLTGNLLDIGRIGRIAKKRGILLIVDASQTAGTFEIDVGKMGIDILCFTGHKALLGPMGTGGLYVRPGVEVKSLFSGGSGVQSRSRSHPKQMPTALEAGTLNVHGLAGLSAGVRYLLSRGIGRLREREAALARRFYEEAGRIDGIRFYGDFSDKLRCPIVTLNVRDYDSGQVSDALAARYGIATRPGTHCAPLLHDALGTGEQGAVRFSFSHFNTMDEIEAAVSALRELAREE